MCRGCGRRAPRHELERYVWGQGEVLRDVNLVLPGRGVYCCKDEACRTRLLRNTKVLKRVLRLRAEE
ncbi:MAG: hypothetical protein CSA34_00350 [Desulfobulbus propionicus]|nr:MAG: hypothetical protein CSA34_00350 [Desulfobulbus propionicus]